MATTESERPHEEGRPTRSPFGSFEAIEPHEFVPGVRLRAIGGDQVLLCKVTYEPGRRVARHAHDATEQVMYILAGEVTMTVGDQTRTLIPGDTAVVNRGLDHELYSATGV